MAILYHVVIKTNLNLKNGGGEQNDQGNPYGKAYSALNKSCNSYDYRLPAVGSKTE